MQITVLGAGSWGTALSILLARNGHEVHLLGRSGEEIEILRERRENLRYLPGFVIPEGVSFGFLQDAPETPDMTVVALPSSAVRGAIRELPGAQSLVVVAAKGLEAGTAQLMNEVLHEVWPDAEVGALSGPNLAIEIVRGIPTAAVSAFPTLASADKVRSAFMCRTFRVYLSTDVVGVELAGALKNVLAIGGGMCDGLGFGDNTKGALLARGLHEMTVLGLAMGARVETFMGLAGVGDLFATAVSTLSRNYRVGLAIGKGESLASVLEAIGQVAEGVSTSEAALVLGRKHGVPMPVCEAIEAVVRGRVRPLDAVTMLMERSPREEGFLPTPESGSPK